MKILTKELLVDRQGVRVVKISVEAPDIARKARAGQFVVVIAAPEGERIPLTVVETDTTAGAVTLIFQETGYTTKFLGKFKAGDELYAIAGPLGHPTVIKKYGNIIVVGGGVGIAEIYPVAKAMKDAGNRIVAILGSRSKDFLILESEMKAVSDEVLVATDDGTYGVKAFTTDILSDILNKGKYDLIYSVGPIPMMKKTAYTAKPFGVKTIVSLNALIVDATGMCGCCRVTISGVTKFSCIDGPEFDAQGVDWDELEKRNRIYSEKEKHICKLNKT